VRHEIRYDDEKTLAAKYKACAAAGILGVGAWSGDMLSYAGDANARALAKRIWSSLDAFTGRGGGIAAPAVHMISSNSDEDVLVRGAAIGTPRAQRLARRYRKRFGIAEDTTAFIPGYNPCKHKPASSYDPRGCADGLVCISPLPNSPSPGGGGLKHESGGCYPVRPSISYVARTIVPPIPPTFRPEEATVYYYLNLVMPDDGNSDVSNSSKGYGFMNQFVPQLELGEALCGSTGAAGDYVTGACSIVDPLRSWVIQSQYFFGVINRTGIPDPAGVGWTPHAVTGETVPVFPGETVVTNFTMYVNGTWLLQFSVDESASPGGAIPDRGVTRSVVQVDHPYMNPKFSWLSSDFNHTLVGACNEVYNLQPRHGDVARPLNMSITITDHDAVRVLFFVCSIVISCSLSHTLSLSLFLSLSLTSLSLALSLSLGAGEWSPEVVQRLERE